MSDHIIISINAGARNEKTYGAFAVIHNGKIRPIDPVKAGVSVGDDKIARMDEFKGLTTSNQAGYAALVYAARYAHRVQQASPKPLTFTFRMPNNLVVKQVSGEWNCKDVELQGLREHALKFLNTLRFSITKS